MSSPLDGQSQKLIQLAALCTFFEKYNGLVYSRWVNKVAMTAEQLAIFRSYVLQSYAITQGLSLPLADESPVDALVPILINKGLTP